MVVCGGVWHVGSPSSAPRAPKHPWEETAKCVTWQRLSENHLKLFCGHLGE